MEILVISGLSGAGKSRAAKDLEDQLNELLKRQGKLTTEAKDIKKLKKKLKNKKKH